MFMLEEVFDIHLDVGTACSSYNFLCQAHLYILFSSDTIQRVLLSNTNLPISFVILINLELFYY
jgi:hypothetical protein